MIISRTRYFERQTGNKTHIIACGVSLANAEDLGKWMGYIDYPVMDVLQMTSANSGNSHRGHSYIESCRCHRIL